VTQTPGPAETRQHVIVIGAGRRGRTAGAELLAAGITDFVILDQAPATAPGRPETFDGQLRPGREVISSVFDHDTDAWALRTTAGEIFRGDVVIAAHRPIYVPWIPELAGRNDFRGVSFHAGQWDPDFDPSGRRIAVIGADATAGHYIERLVESAASVTVFAHAPRRMVPEVPFWTTLWTTRVKRWLRRHTRSAAHGGRSRSAAALVGSAIDALTPSGIHTSDGVDHSADTIIYGTGFSIPDRISDETLVGAGRLTIRRAWDDGMEPYLGVAVHGFPNYFFITGPDIVAQTRYVVECVGLMKYTASTRIEVRRSSEQVFNERVYTKPAEPHRVASAFDLSFNPGEDDETYDGAATLTIAGTRHPVRVRLTGHLDPIDGHYHWQGTVFSSLPEPLPDDAIKEARAATLTVGDRSAPARIIEQTPWGTHSVAGVGAPPYDLSGR
jgi:cation diffusion facilitator CzcD-associated flavoprotein CzcO